MKNNIVKYKQWKGVLIVTHINEEPVEDAVYFDLDHLNEDIAELVELFTGSRGYTLKKCIF